jgi:hypothetical protein
MNVDPGKFVIPYAEFANKYLGDNHFFIPLGKRENTDDFSKKIRNVIPVEYPQTYNPVAIFKFIKVLMKELKEADIIVWHSLFINRFLLAFLSNERDILAKSAWLVWGGDLYGWEKRGAFKGWLNRKYQTFVANLRSVILVFPPDEVYLRNSFNFRGKVFCANYMDVKTSIVLDGLIEESESHEGINIIIGNSATTSIDHKHSIDVISKLNNDDIKVYIPLSYGQKKYASEIEKYAINSLGEDKVKCIHEYLNSKEYYSLLSHMDAAFYDTDRQIALGNIYALLYLNKSIFIKENSVMYNYFCSIGLTVQKTEISEGDNIEMLIRNTPCETNHKFAKKIYDLDVVNYEWNYIFDELTR